MCASTDEFDKCENAVKNLQQTRAKNVQGEGAFEEGIAKAVQEFFQHEDDVHAFLAALESRHANAKSKLKVTDEGAKQCTDQLEIMKTRWHACEKARMAKEKAQAALERAQQAAQAAAAATAATEKQAQEDEAKAVGTEEKRESVKAAGLKKVKDKQNAQAAAEDAASKAQAAANQATADFKELLGAWEADKKPLLKAGLLPYFESYCELRQSQVEAVGKVVEALRAVSDVPQAAPGTPASTPAAEPAPSKGPEPAPEPTPETPSSNPFDKADDGAQGEALQAAEPASTQAGMRETTSDLT